jgi:hypothetical protein
MPDERISDVTGFPADSDPKRPATPSLPIQESQQPDPMLQMSIGGMGAGGLTLVALVAVLILGVVFYGLNSGGTAEQTAAAPPAPPVAHSAKPQAGGNSGAATPSAPRANESGVKG